MGSLLSIWSEYNEVYNSFCLLLPFCAREGRSKSPAVVFYRRWLSVFFWTQCFVRVSDQMYCHSCFPFCLLCPVLRSCQSTTESVQSYSFFFWFEPENHSLLLEIHMRMWYISLYSVALIPLEEWQSVVFDYNLWRKSVYQLGNLQCYLADNTKYYFSHLFFQL